jgi:hypothetical protein
MPAALAREPSPGPAVVPAPPPVSKVSFKEWQARRKLERAKEGEVAQERERVHEREWKREHEKDAAQGEDKENEVIPVKAEDGLTRILPGIRRSAVSNKPPMAELLVLKDVEIADAVPLAVALAVAPFVTLDELQLKAKMVPLSMAVFVATGNEHLSLLAVSGVVESRTPSPSLPNRIKREASLNDMASPVVLAPKSPPSDVPAPPSPQRPTFHSPPQSERHSPRSRSSAPIGGEVRGRNTAHVDNPLCCACPVFSIFLWVFVDFLFLVALSLILYTSLSLPLPLSCSNKLVVLLYIIPC